MEILVSILLIILIYISFQILKELRGVASTQQRIWEDLFNTPNSGLGLLAYLKYINDKLEKKE